MKKKYYTLGWMSTKILLTDKQMQLAVQYDNYNPASLKRCDNGKENPRFCYGHLKAPNHRKRQLREVSKSCGNQSAHISMIIRRYYVAPLQEVWMPTSAYVKLGMD